MINLFENIDLSWLEEFFGEGRDAFINLPSEVKIVLLAIIGVMLLIGILTKFAKFAKAAIILAILYFLLLKFNII